uniref:Uncharacterized protein n=1 Tax=uncultured myxobacterium HF0200_19H16 TaxID=723559 RepID=E7C3W5_9BACT|nr:hypothetical protein [uncultured myxobacterium HF0200_19H16]
MNASLTAIAGLASTAKTTAAYAKPTTLAAKVVIAIIGEFASRDPLA